VHDTFLGVDGHDLAFKHVDYDLEMVCGCVCGRIGSRMALTTLAGIT
jgi:hypothetical protein